LQADRGYVSLVVKLLPELLPHFVPALQTRERNGRVVGHSVPTPEFLPDRTVQRKHRDALTTRRYMRVSSSAL
jgi:hypothetical protein